MSYDVYQNLSIGAGWALTKVLSKKGLRN